MGAVPLDGGPPMAPLPPLQQSGFGTSRWRLQGNATSGLRAGGRGIIVFSCRTRIRLLADFVAKVPKYQATMPSICSVRFHEALTPARCDKHATSEREPTRRTVF